MIVRILNGEWEVKWMRPKGAANWRVIQSLVRFTDANWPIKSIVTHLYSYFGLRLQWKNSWRKINRKREELGAVVDEIEGIDGNKQSIHDRHLLIMWNRVFKLYKHISIGNTGVEWRNNKVKPSTAVSTAVSTVTGCSPKGTGGKIFRNFKLQ